MFDEFCFCDFMLEIFFVLFEGFDVLFDFGVDIDYVFIVDGCMKMIMLIDCGLM